MSIFLNLKYQTMKVPEQYRNRKHPELKTTFETGNNGLFEVPHQKISGYIYYCIASQGMGWDHVSVSLYSPNRDVKRCPTWEEMCYVKDLFWDAEEAVMQIHPRKSDYISNHPFCLHLWRPIGQEIPLPNSIFVGLQKDNV